jgi:hypothetical protein
LLQRSPPLPRPRRSERGALHAGGLLAAAHCSAGTGPGLCPPAAACTRA